MKRRKDEDYESSMTPEEKEWIRKVMEDPAADMEFDFFKDLERNIPPPEYFMRGEPDRPWRTFRRRTLKVTAAVCAVFICALVLCRFMVPQEIEADKMPFKLSSENMENGFVETELEDGDDVTKIDVKITDESDVERVGKSIFPQLKIPTYISLEFIFNFLSIKNNDDGGWACTYLYGGHDSFYLKIEQFVLLDDIGNTFSNFVKGFEKLENSEVYFGRDDIQQVNILVCWCSDREYLVITGDLDKEELLNIYNGLE